MRQNMALSLTQYEILLGEDFAKFQAISQKSRLEITEEEDSIFVSLKEKAEKAQAIKQKEESLAFLKNKEVFPLADLFEVLKSVGWKKEDFTAAIKHAFPVEVIPSPILAIYKFKSEDGQPQEQGYQINNGERLSGQFGKAVKDGGIKAFAAGLTQEGKAWLLADASKITVGKYIGNMSYPNLNELKKKQVDWFDKKNKDRGLLFKALGIED